MSQSVSASVVRQFFIDNPTLVPEGDKSVGPDSAGRGRLSAPAVAVFHEQNKGKTYEQGTSAPVASATVPLTWYHEQPSGRKVKKSVDLTRKEIRALVPSCPDRGRLSQAHMEAAGEAYSAKMKAERGQAAAAKAEAKSAEVPAAQA